jgi:hypothetical protein
MMREKISEVKEGLRAGGGKFGEGGCIAPPALDVVIAQRFQRLRAG